MVNLPIFRCIAGPAQDAASAESTVDEAWQLLRRAWRAKGAGNEAWGRSCVEEAVRPEMPMAS